MPRSAASRSSGAGWGRERAAVAGFAAAGRFAHQLILQPRLAAQLFDQADHGVAAIARARDVSNADVIGLELLVTRIAAQLQEASRATERPTDSEPLLSAAINRRFEHAAARLRPPDGVLLR